ncbi:MAG: hypothetical protein V5B34_10300 [Accumulibacter sp.]
MLYRSKVGRCTEEEFATAVGQFHATSKPFIYTYFCDSPADRATASAEDLRRFPQDVIPAAMVAGLSD